MPEENFWTLWCKERLTEADTLTIRLGATPSRLSSAHLHHPPIFLQAGCPSCCQTNSVKALKATSVFRYRRRRYSYPQQCYLHHLRTISLKILVQLKHVATLPCEISRTFLTESNQSLPDCQQKQTRHTYRSSTSRSCSRRRSGVQTARFSVSVCCQ